MVKIAILEPDPRVCGPSSWAYHLRAGFRALGHTCDVVTSTKSGRARKGWGTPGWGNKWWSEAPDKCVRDNVLGHLLADQDLIILPEPKSPAVDREAVKAGVVPVYVSALLACGKPFVTALHGNNYEVEDAPFLRHLLGAPNFVGKLIIHSRRSWESGFEVMSTPGFEVPLPYTARLPITAPYPTGRTVGTTGRFIFNKGPQVLAFAGRYLDPSTTIELWGSAAAGLGASITFTCYEGLLPFASNYKRYGDQEAKKDDPRVTEHGNTIRPFHWDVRLQDAALVRYLGNYTDPVATCGRLTVHVNLTGWKYSGGLVEYSTLEAMDAGSLCIMPEHVSDSRYKAMTIDLTNPPGGVATTLKSDALLHTVAADVDELLAADASFPEWRADTVRHNRAQLRAISDPAIIADRILQEVA